MHVDTGQLREAATRLELLAARLESSAAPADARARRTGELLDSRPADALHDAWRAVHDGLGLLVDGYRTYARGFAELAGRYDDLDAGLLRTDAAAGPP